jgi:hypothetical protein
VQATRRVCAWIDRGTLAPCPATVAAFALTVATRATVLDLDICDSHLGAVVVAAFASGGVPVQTVTVERRVPVPV